MRRIVPLAGAAVAALVLSLPAVPALADHQRTTGAAHPAAAGHQLVGYLHASFANGSGYTRIEDVPADWNIVALAFADADSSGHVSFTPCPASECGSSAETPDQLRAGIKAQQAAGKKVVISIGGANGEVTLSTTAARDAFVSSVADIIDTYGLDGVDLDFENQSLVLQAGDTDLANPTTPSVVNLISAVRTLKSRYGDGFTLTMAPETFMVQLGYQFYGGDPNTGADRRAGSWLPVIYALRDDLTLLNVQLYNSGPITGLDDQYHTMGGADFLIAMTDMLTAGFPVSGTGMTFPALPANKIGVGLPASQNAGNGYVAPVTVDTALDCLTRGTGCGGYSLRGGSHADLAGLMTWSINWDRYNNWEFSHNYDDYFG